MCLKLISRNWLLFCKHTHTHMCIISTCLYSLTFLRYHIKYMHIGDYKKEVLEGIILSLHPSLKLRLRFLVQSTTAGAALTPVMTAPHDLH